MKKITEAIKVILVDDDPDDRVIFEEAIRQILKNCELTTFADGSEIINHLGNEENMENLPDILFLDINMPRVNGIETLKIIRKDLRIDNLTIAMYSSSKDSKDVEDALISGANVYINKPTSFPLLVQTLHRIFTMNMHHDTSDLRMDTFMFTI